MRRKVKVRLLTASQFFTPLVNPLDLIVGAALCALLLAMTARFKARVVSRAVFLEFSARGAFARFGYFGCAFKLAA